MQPTTPMKAWTHSLATSPPVPPTVTPLPSPHPPTRTRFHRNPLDHSEPPTLCHSVATKRPRAQPILAGIIWGYLATHRHAGRPNVRRRGFSGPIPLFGRQLAIFTTQWPLMSVQKYQSDHGRGDSRPEQNSQQCCHRRRRQIRPNTLLSRRWEERR